MTINIIEPVGKSFPNANERIASYDPATQFVIFEQLTQERFLDIVKNPLLIGNEKDYAVIEHEFRHAADHIGTLWGQSNLLKLQKALTARLENDEYRFHSIVDYKNEERQIFHADYYSEEYGKTKYTGANSRWIYSTSTGLRFTAEGHPDEDNPISFAKFSTHENKPLLRVPITVATLLETNATHEEIDFMLNSIRNNYPNDWQFNMKIYTDELLEKLIYNQNFAIYNAAVHITANSLNIKHINDAFLISSAIATLALNLPSELSAGLKITLDPESTNGKRARNMLKNNDPGFKFYTLCTNYAKKYKESGEYSLDELLDSNGLPNRIILEDTVKKEFENIFSQTMDTGRFMSKFGLLNKQGQLILEAGGLDGLNAPVMQKLFKANYRPSVAFKDGGIEFKKDVLGTLSGRDDEFLDDSTWFNVVKELDYKMQSFYEIRGL